MTDTTIVAPSWLYTDSIGPEATDAEKIDHYSKQINGLAQVLLEHFPTEIGRGWDGQGTSEGACEVAIRLLFQYRALLDAKKGPA